MCKGVGGDIVPYTVYARGAGDRRRGCRERSGLERGTAAANRRAGAHTDDFILYT